MTSSGSGNELTVMEVEELFLCHLPVDVFAIITQNMLSLDICKLYLCGNSRLNFTLRHGGVRTFHHHISHRQWWPTIVTLFDINDFRIFKAYSDMPNSKCRQNIHIPSKLLDSLPSSLTRLHIGEGLHSSFYMLFEHFTSLEHLHLGHYSWITSEEWASIPSTISSLTVNGPNDLLAMSQLSLEANTNLTYLHLSCKIVKQILLPPQLLYFICTHHNSTEALTFDMGTKFMNITKWPSQLLHLEMRDHCSYPITALDIAQLPQTLTYLAFPAHLDFKEWSVLPPKLRHFEITTETLFGFELPSLSLLPQSLTSIRMNHNIETTDTSSLPNLTSYTGLNGLYKRESHIMPSSITDLRVQLLNLSNCDLLPPNLRCLDIEAFQAGTNKTSTPFAFPESLTALRIAFTTAFDAPFFIPQQNLVELYLVVGRTSIFSKLPPTLRILTLRVNSLDYDWLSGLPMDLESLTITYGEEYNRRLDNLPNSLTSLTIGSKFYILSGDQLRFLPQRLRYLTLSSSSDRGWNFADVNKLPPSLFFLNLNIYPISGFNLERVHKMCPDLAELYIHNKARDQQILLRGNQIGIRISLCDQVNYPFHQM
jgi:hypothetical protein